MKMNKKIIIGLFILTSLIQFAAPLSMIWEREKVAQNGTEFKFKTRPIDPYDPFRGKYINLYFENNSVPVSNIDDWVSQEEGYFMIEKDSEGFAEVVSAHLEEPKEGNYIKMKCFHYYGADSTINFKYPFERFYMNENEALNAEKAYRSSNRDRNKKIAYAIVKILNGETVLEDVIIGGKSAKDLM